MFEQTTVTVVVSNYSFDLDVWFWEVFLIRHAASNRDREVHHSEMCLALPSAVLQEASK